MTRNTRFAIYRSCYESLGCTESKDAKMVTSLTLWFLAVSAVFIDMTSSYTSDGFIDGLPLADIIERGSSDLRG